MAENQPVQPAGDPATGASPVAVPVPSAVRPGAPTGAPVNRTHYHKGRLTREGMEHVIRSGGSVLGYQQTGTDDAGNPILTPAVLTQVEHLPSHADAARQSGDADTMKRALDENARLRRQLEDQDRQLRTAIKNAPPAPQPMGQAGTTPPSTPAAPGTPPPPGPATAPAGQTPRK